MRTVTDPVIRFWRFVDHGAPDECWLWKGKPEANGYGRIRISPDPSIHHVKAHRFSWMLANGRDPGDKMVLHKCDVPACVNPAHLYLGDHDRNMRDKVERGRQPRGEEIWGKLTAADVADIRTSGKSQRKLAARYGVVKSAIWAIQVRRIWKHVP